jgi:hypothetical protein
MPGSCSASLVLLLLRAAASAQPSGGSVHGIVTDNSGAVIPSAAIQLSGAAGSRSTVALGDGSYTFTGLAPGTYTLKVAFPGFVPVEKTIAVEDGASLQLPVQLTVGAERQSVTVKGDPGPSVSVEPDQNATAIVIKGSDLDALPDDPDNLQDMLNALAGPAAGPGGGQIYVDGFSGGQLPPKASIREIRINQNPLSAEYDRLGYGRIEILTKPGSDKFHGGFSFNDSDAYFNSRNPYATNKADYVMRYINANVSGPIGHRASFFFNFYQQTTNTDALIDAVTLNSSLEPVPVQNTVVTPRHRYNINPRVDVQLSKNNTLTVRLQAVNGSADNQGIGQYNLVSRAYNVDNNYQDLQATLTSILSPTVVNDLRFEFVRIASENYGDNSVPAINVAASFSGGGAQVGRGHTVTHHYELQDNASMGHGRHTFRFGTRLRRDTLDDASPNNFGGTFTFFGAAGVPVLDANNQVVADPATGQPETTSISSLEQYRRTLLFQQMGYSPAVIRQLGGGASQFAIAGGNPLALIGQDDVSFFAQDDWRVRPGLTVSTGLRYETQTNIQDRRDFAPRLGVAWGPGAKANKPPKLVLRGGVGVFYDRVSDNLILQQLRFNGITQQQYVVTDPDFFPNVPSVASLASGKQPPVTYQLDKRLHAPYNIQTAVSLEKQLPWRTSLAATYIGYHAEHQLRTVDINSPLPGTYSPADPASGLRPYGDAAGNIFQYESDGVSNFNEFVTTANTQFTRKVMLSLAYGRMKVSSDVDGMGMPSDPYNFKADYGRSNLERKNLGQIMGSILAPFGIRLNPLIFIYGGMPYDLTIGRDLNGDTITNDRPAFATDLSRPSVVVTRFGAFDTDPLPGQRIVPRDYLVGNGMWNFNCRIGRTFAFGTVKKGTQGVSGTDQGWQAPTASLGGGQRQQSGGEKRFSLNLNLYVNNVFNHLNRGGWVGNLSSPLFGESTSIYLQRETSNDRTLQFGMQLSF